MGKENSVYKKRKSKQVMAEVSGIKKSGPKCSLYLIVMHCFASLSLLILLSVLLNVWSVSIIVYLAVFHLQLL